MVRILDTTLREGEQTPGVYFGNHIKLGIADILDKVGVDIIEAGHPAVTPEIESAVRQIALKQKSNYDTNHPFRAHVGAHSRTLKQDVDQALECGVGFLGIFYCVSNDRLNHVFKRSLSTAIEQIRDIISYARERDSNLIIRYTPEDTVRSNFENVVEASEAAVRAGADIISVADTTGYMVPGTERSMYDYILHLKDALKHRGVDPEIAVHCHDDRGLALANALDGYRAGADIIDASVMGLGERAGIVDLAQLMVILKAEFNQGQNWDFDLLPGLYELVSKYTNLPVPVNYPVMGKNAFTHCAGIHTHAAIENSVHYQSLDPSIVGRHSTVCLDHMAGLSSVIHSMKLLGETEDKVLASRVLEEVKIVGRKGRVVDADEFSQLLKMCRSYNPSPQISPPSKISEKGPDQRLDITSSLSEAGIGGIET